GVEIGGAGGIARLDATLRRLARPAFCLDSKLGLAGLELLLPLGNRRLARFERGYLGQRSLRALALTGSLLLEPCGGRLELLVLGLERVLALVELAGSSLEIPGPRHRLGGRFAVPGDLLLEPL